MCGSVGKIDVEVVVAGTGSGILPFFVWAQSETKTEKEGLPMGFNEKIFEMVSFGFRPSHSMCVRTVDTVPVVRTVL